MAAYRTGQQSPYATYALHCMQILHGCRCDDIILSTHAAAAVTAIDPAEHCYVACTGAAFVRLHDDIQVKLLHETHFAFFSQISYYSLIVTGQFTGPDTTICRLRV